MQQIQFLIDQNYKNRKTNEFRRLFHGRGNNYKGYKDITIDLIEDVVLLTIFKPIVYEDELLKYLQKRFVQNTIVVQKRYEKQSQVIQGSITKQLYAIENGMRFSLNLTNNQNIGFFGDMIQGRSFLRKISRNKNILNLFSYTCSLSVAAGFKANQVVNVDISKSALSIGRTNHQINQIDTKKIKFCQKDQKSQRFSISQ
ncbi:MAG: class I SAM-dependent methyltransferase [Campylobacterales bacterium]|nr:class I SAM-dependent methyltransferase [Campylobacterales bacterium]